MRDRRTLLFSRSRLAKGAAGNLQPLFPLAADVVGKAFGVELASSSFAKDKFWEAEKVGPGLGVVISGDCREGVGTQES